jgi:branched-chain amino acid transport system substrate-binding protein
MSLLLDAMDRAGSKCNDRKVVRDKVFSTKNRRSVLGTYSIDKDGDTTLNKFGRWLVKNGELSNLKTVTVKEDSNGKPLGAGGGS